MSERGIYCNTVSQQTCQNITYISNFGEPSPGSFVRSCSRNRNPTRLGPIHRSTVPPAGVDSPLGAGGATPGAEAWLQFFGHRCLEEGLR